MLKAMASKGAEPSPSDGHCHPQRCGFLQACEPLERIVQLDQALAIAQPVLQEGRLQALIF